MARILLLTVDIDLPDAPVNGGVHRVRQLTRQLRGLGHEVVVSMPFENLADKAAPQEVLAVSFSKGNFDDCVKSIDPDIVLCEQWHLASQVQRIGKPLWIDLHGSLLNENAFRRAGGSEGAVRYDQEVRAKLDAFSSASAITCAGGRQRLYFKGWQAVAGRGYDDADVAVVPLSLPVSVHPGQTGVGSSALRFLYAGNLWPWIDLDCWLPAFFEVVAERPDDKVDFFIDDPLQHRDGTTVISECGAGHSLDRLIREGRISIHGRLPHDQFVLQASGYDCVVDLFSWNSERELAITTRTLEYLSLGVPVIYPDHAELAGEIAVLDDRLVLGDYRRETIRGAIEAIESLADRRDTVRSQCHEILLEREQQATETCRDIVAHLMRAPTALRTVNSGVNRLISLANESVRGLLSSENERAFRAESEADGLRQQLKGKATLSAMQLREANDLANEQRDHIHSLEGQLDLVREVLGRAQSELGEAEHRIKIMRDESSAKEFEYSRMCSGLSEQHEKEVSLVRSELNQARASQGAWDRGARIAQAHPSLARRGLRRRTRLLVLYFDHLLVRLYMSVWQRLRSRRIFPGI